MQILAGDCVDVMREMPDATFDALVTDPPAGIGFMGKEWDGAKGGRDEWVAWLSGVLREALRVVKPGAHGLVWALPRTSHWTMWALEDAGWEIRDVVTHLFGTGFPKSLDIGKAIDKAAGAEREVVGTKVGLPGYSLAPSNGNNLYEGRFGGTGDPERESQITAPSTDAAKQWDGWGTALKPAAEYWVLVRKPFKGTVAGNVVQYGTGGLNIDGCRIGSDGGTTGASLGPRGAIYGEGLNGVRGKPVPGLGRWPSNVVLSEEAAAEVDEQSGYSVSPGRVTRGAQRYVGRFGLGRQDSVPAPSDSGGASRFFYTPKAPPKERPTVDGLVKHPTVKSQSLMRYLCRLITPPGGVILDPFVGSGSTLLAAKAEGFDAVGIEADEDYVRLAEYRCGIELNQTA